MESKKLVLFYLFNSLTVLLYWIVLVFVLIFSGISLGATDEIAWIVVLSLFGSNLLINLLIIQNVKNKYIHLALGLVITLSLTIFPGILEFI